MVVVTPALAEQASANPEESFRVIVRVEGDMDARQGELEAADFAITRRLRLIHGFGALAAGNTILRATTKDWIVSIEPDGTVHTMSGEK